MPGPLPDPAHRHRASATIPTTNLPASGRKGRPPNPPDWMELGTAGAAWWRWSWSTPQACGWSAGDRPVIARRASLEDDLATIAAVDSVDVLLVGTEDLTVVRAVIARLAALATGRLNILREMRELDDRLGLTPKGLAALRWRIVEDTPADVPADGVPSLDDRRARLTNAS